MYKKLLLSLSVFALLNQGVLAKEQSENTSFEDIQNQDSDLSPEQALIAKFGKSTKLNWTQDVLPAAAAATESYYVDYNGDKDFASNPVPERQAEFKVLDKTHDYFDGGHGFAAAALLHKPSQTLYIAFRGTETSQTWTELLQDLRSDIGIAVRGTLGVVEHASRKVDQYTGWWMPAPKILKHVVSVMSWLTPNGTLYKNVQEAKKFAQIILSKVSMNQYKDKISKVALTGHSLGGHNTQVVTSFINDKFRDVGGYIQGISFNGPGVGTAYIKDYGFDKQPSLFNVIRPGDIVGMGGYHVGNNIYIPNLDSSDSEAQKQGWGNHSMEGIYHEFVTKGKNPYKTGMKLLKGAQVSIDNEAFYASTNLTDVMEAVTAKITEVAQLEDKFQYDAKAHDDFLALYGQLQQYFAERSAELIASPSEEELSGFKTAMMLYITQIQKKAIEAENKNPTKKTFYEKLFGKKKQ
jgi:hypothetical protein